MDGDEKARGSCIEIGNSYCFVSLITFLYSWFCQKDEKCHSEISIVGHSYSTQEPTIDMEQETEKEIYSYSQQERCKTSIR
jgi:hypothetical protein